jgi:hypothetical protein
MAENSDIEGIIGNINELEKSLLQTIQYSDSPTIRANAENELKKLQDVKARYINNTNSLYEKAYAYDEASQALIRYQNNTSTALSEANENLSLEERMALREIENKRRMVQINTYYSDKYADYIFIIKMIILLCAIIILLSVLTKRSILSRGMFTLLLIISCSIIICIVIIRWISMRYRDPINYKQFKFYVPSYTPTSSPTTYGYTKATGVADASSTPADTSSDSSNMTGDDSMYGNTGRISGIILDI